MKLFDQPLNVLDLFCGMGGWSIGFHRHGFRCRGVDIVDVGYPYELIVRDIKRFDGRPWKNVENLVILASPPCTEFSNLTLLSYEKGQRGPPNPGRGMELVREAKRVIDEARPRFWIMENVFGSYDHIRAVMGEPMLEAKPWLLWGSFPSVDLGPDGIGPKVTLSSIGMKNMGIYRKELAGYDSGYLVARRNRSILPRDFPFDPLRSYKRARIPIWVSMRFAMAARREIERPSGRLAGGMETVSLVG